MKVRIEKEVKLNGDKFFNVYADDNFVRCFYFSDNEKEKLNEALQLAKYLESITVIPQKQIVYETEPEVTTEAIDQ